MNGIKEVAKRAGVSTATVSNVINKSKPVSKELTDLVEKAVKELNYQPNFLASGLKSRKTNILGIILPKISSIYFPPVLDGIEDTAKKYGYKLIFFNSNFNMEMEKAYVELLRNNWVDGIIIDSSCDVHSENEYAQYLSTLACHRKKIPVVSLERALNSDLISSVVFDGRKNGYEVTKSLLDAGRRRIIHIAGPLKISLCVDICKGYKNALTDMSVDPDERYIHEGDYTPSGGYAAMKRLINNGLQFDGVFAANDQMAIGAIKAVKEMGLQIPRDVSVIGTDNTFAGTLIEPSLSTVNVPRYKMGCDAVELLVRHVHSPKLKPESIEESCNLIIRKSSQMNGDNTWDLFGW
jgi:DNA-binding LacI/PurR family transcriptional regulator